jgi:hypothetical protein
MKVTVTLLIFLFALSASTTVTVAQEAKSKVLIKTTWDRFINDYEPSLREGVAGLMLPADVVKKYMDKQVEWDGVFKGLIDSDQGGEPKVLIGMKPRSIPVKPGMGSPFTATIDFLFANVDSSKANQWKALPLESKIRFRVTIIGIIVFYPADKMREEVRGNRPNDHKFRLLW